MARRPGGRGRAALLASAAAAFTPLALASPAGAVLNLFVNGSGTGVWEDGNNWSSGSPPVAGDSAFIDSGFAVTSSAATNVCNELQVGVGTNSYGSNGNPGGTGTLSLLPGSLITTGGNLVVGQDQTSDNSSGTIDIATGATLNINGGNSLLGFFGQSLSDPTVGTINVSGGSFNFNAGNNNGTMWVGGDSLTNHVGRGAFNVFAGTVTGAALRVGDFGTGTFNMSGGTLTSNFYMSVGLGNNPNAGSGTVNVTGGTMNLAQLTVNEAKAADCVVNESGGTINIGAVAGIDGYNARIGLSAIGRGLYYMTGGTLNVAGNDLLVGGGLYGQMNISGASAVTVNYQSVTGTHSDYGFALGNNDNGTALVNQLGGTVNVLNTSLLGVFFNGTNGGVSTYNLAGGSITTGGISSDNGSTVKTFNFNGGTLVAGQDMTVPNPARNAAPTSFFTTIGAGNGTIDTAGHTVTWVTPLTGTGGLTKAGAGSLVLTAPPAFTGPAVATGGTLTFAPTAGAGVTPLTVSSLNVASGAAVTLQPVAAANTRSVLTTATLTLAGSGGAWTGKVDLGNNDLVVTGGDLATLTSQAKAGFSGGTWAGPGLASATAAADSAHLTALGVIRNSVDGTATGAPLYGAGTALGSFDGTSPSATAILIKYTYYGDTNLDGVVNAADYTRIDAGFAAHLIGWANGDLNYDGVVDGSDYTLMDNAFNQQGATLSPNAAAAPVASAAAQVAAVPEPASLALVGLAAAAGTMGRRRPHRRA